MTTRTALAATSAFYGASRGCAPCAWPSALAAGLGPRWRPRAYRLFGTPLPPSLAAPPPPWGAGWRVRGLAFENGNLSPSHHASEWRPAPRPPARAAGARLGRPRAGQMLPLAEALAQQGLRPLLLEMPAHGRSAGSVSNLPQFARAIDYVAARLQHGPPAACGGGAFAGRQRRGARRRGAWRRSGWCCWRRRRRPR